MGLLTDRKRRRERMPHDLEQYYREHVVQRAIAVMQNNRLATGLFYLFIGLPVSYTHLTLPTSDLV